jgi:hypothetical protein
VAVITTEGLMTTAVAPLVQGVDREQVEIWRERPAMEHPLVQAHAHR